MNTNMLANSSSIWDARPADVQGTEQQHLTLQRPQAASTVSRKGGPGQVPLAAALPGCGCHAMA